MDKFDVLSRYFGYTAFRKGQEEVVDCLTGPGGLCRNTHEFHITGLGEETGPEQVVLAGQNPDFCGALSAFFCKYSNCICKFFRKLSL